MRPEPVGQDSGPSTTKIEAPSPFNASPALVKCELAVFKPEALERKRATPMLRCRPGQYAQPTPPLGGLRVEWPGLIPVHRDQHALSEERHLTLIKLRCGICVLGASQ